jgi:type I restriction enzyme S subunit
MSEFPSDWKECLLGEVVEKITSGGTPKADNPELYGGGIPFLKIDDITSASKYLKSHKVTINERGLAESSAKIVPTGTLLLTMYGTIGRCCITTYPVATNQAIASFLGHPEVELDYLYYALESKADEFATASSQTTQANISAGILKQTPIAIPPLPEQKKIAEILSGVDMAIENVQHATSRIDHAIQGIRDQTQTGEGNHMRIGDLIAKISTGVSVNSENRPCRASEYGVLKVSCISNGVFYASENKVIHGEERERASMSVRKGMLLMSRANTPELVGACGIATNDHDNLFLPDKIWNLELSESAPCDKNWLNNALNSGVARSRVRDASTGTSNSMRNISQSNFCEIELLIPPPEIQQAQANMIDSLQKRRKTFAVKLARYFMLKEALSSDLLSGRKRVSV